MSEVDPLQNRILRTPVEIVASEREVYEGLLHRLETSPEGRIRSETDVAADLALEIGVPRNSVLTAITQARREGILGCVQGPIQDPVADRHRCQEIFILSEELQT